MSGFIGVVLAVIAIFIAAIRSSKLADRVRRLEVELAMLRRQQGSSPQPSAIPSPPPVASLPSEIAPPQAPAQPPRSRQEWEALVGGKLFNWIGALALIIGVGFFLKYAFDNDLISEPVRVMLGALAGLALLFVAHVAHKKKFDIFAQGLVGAGLAILYLSVYAAFNFYHLLHPAVAFGLMVAITALAFEEAMRYDSLAIALLGWAGAFLTPFLVGSKEASEVGLFGYLTVLDAGLLALILRKQAWAVIEPLALAGTWIIYFYWWSQAGGKADVAVTATFLTAFWLLFHVQDVYRALTRPPSTSVLPHITTTTNAFVYFAGMAALFNREYPDWNAAVTLLIGVAYAATLWIVRFKADSVTRGRFVLAAILFAVIATGQHYIKFTLTMLWSAEAVVALALGLVRRAFSVWCAGVGILILSLLTFLSVPDALSYVPASEFHLLFNARAAALLVLIASYAASVLLFRQWPQDRARYVPGILSAGWQLLVFTLLTVETLDFFRSMMSSGMASTELERLKNLQQLSVSGVWLCYSVVLLAFGLWRRQSWLRIAAMLLFGITIVKAFFFDLSFLETLYRIISFIGLGVILVAVSYLYQRFKTVLFDVKSTES